MARIRGADTGPELIVRRGLWAAGIRFRLQVRTPGGRADLVIPSVPLAVFVDGCFWHGCPEHYVRPRSRNDFWDSKLRENVDRDRRQILALEEAGWRVIRIWEHQLMEAPDKVLMALVDAVKSRRRLTRQWRVVRVEPLVTDGSVERRFLEDVRAPEMVRVEERKRSTRKVGRVRSRRVFPSHP